MSEAAKPWAPEKCPITQRPFFMWIEHHKTGEMVPTYGGPYDSYTLAEFDGEDFVCERFDHDAGGWLVDCVEGLGVKLVDDQSLVIDPNNTRYDEIEAFAAAPVAAQPGLTQQTLDDVMAGIPARDAEIEALRKEIEALQAAPVKPYSLDLDPAGIRALTADAISGALALGFQGVSPPPNNEHWLAPFWEIGRESAVQAQQPVSGADRLPVKGDPWSGWACQHPGKLPRLYGDKAIAELNHHPEEGDRLFQLAECTQQDADKVDAALAEMVHAMFRSGNSVPVTRITIDRKQYDAAIDAARKEPGQ
uniref:hypothetical protein n=1 Tax=Alcaligenes faecalis TaxID=511 RepID=UPI003CFF22E0